MKNTEFKQIFFSKKIKFIVIVFFTIIKTLLLVGLSLVIKNILDIQTISELPRGFLNMIIYCISYFAITIITNNLLNDFVYQMLIVYKNYYFDAFLYQVKSNQKDLKVDPISFYSNDINVIENYFLRGIFDLIVYVLMFLSAIIIMSFFSIKMTIIAIGVTLVPFLISTIIGKKLQQLDTMISKHNMTFVRLCKNIIDGFSVIKSFGVEKYFSQVFINENNQIELHKKNRKVTEGNLSGISTTLSVLSQMIIFCTGMYFVLTGDITIGVLTAFIQLTNYIVQPMQIVPTLLSNVKSGMNIGEQALENIAVNSKKIDELFIELPKDTKEITVKFHNVTFEIEERKLLNEINFEFEAGKKYAIVGESGSGKSTLLKIIQGYYHDYTGNVLYNNIELKTLSSLDVLKSVSIVEQDVYIFDASIYDNITLYQNYPKEEVQEVVKLAQLENLIAEKGKDYMCGINGGNLSGGERQRVSIARMLLKKAPIIMLDEATSALDNKTAYIVEQNILNTQEETLKMVITHRYRSDLLRQYDNIIVFDKGKIVEVGEYDNLMKAQQYFYKMMKTLLKD